jgi:CTP:molybdopterin cytidylyltransferase MocA
MRVAAIVLAAGEASRFGSPKQRILLPRVLERLRETSVDEIVVVAGAYELAIDDTRVVHCPDWERGPGASLRCGLAALAEDVEAAVVVLADGPYLAPRAVERILDDWRTNGGVVAACYAGGRSHPLVLGRADWDNVPDDGLRDRAVRLVPCDDLGAPGDVDVPEDLERL